MMINKINSLCSAVFVCFATTAFAQPFTQPNKIEYALQAIKYAYVDTVDEKKITDDAIRAMVKDLDPHSVYIPVDEIGGSEQEKPEKFQTVS